MQNLNTLKYVKVVDPIEINDLDPINITGTIDEVANIVNIEEIQNIQNIDFVPDPYIELMVGNYPEADPVNVYSRCVTIDDVDWTTICPDNQGPIISLPPFVPVTWAISADFGVNPVVDFQVRIGFYDSPTSTALQAVFLTTDGVNKVTIGFGVTLYRIQSMVVMSTSAIPLTADFYVYDNALVPDINGVPPSWFDFMRVGSDVEYSNQRETAIYYSPPNKQTILKSFVFTCDQAGGNRREVLLRVHPQNSVVTYDKRFYVTNANLQVFRTHAVLPPGFTIEVLARAASGANQTDLTLSINLVQFDI